MRIFNYISVLVLLFITFSFGACGDSGNDDNTTGANYTVTYDGNGHSGGSVPVDSDGTVPSGSEAVTAKFRLLFSSIF